MNYRKQFRVSPGQKIRLGDIDPSFTGADEKKESAHQKLKKLHKRMDDLQFLLYAEQKRSFLICLQAPDAGGKDGVIRHVIGSMNPQGCRVVSFKQPTSTEAAHDFLWRVEAHAPGRGQVAVFNRSHYEDVIVVRVHSLVPAAVWSERFAQINDFERRLVAANTHILKFFLHISKEEQLDRFHDRLEDEANWWKISEADYTERERWDEYVVAYQDAINNCSTEHAPWFVIPSNCKWFRNLAIAEIIVETMEAFHMQVPAPHVNIADIRQRYQHGR
ncbi:MAG: polyphosphate kinase 2 family protein [Gemmatimonas sp.]